MTAGITPDVAFGKGGENGRAKLVGEWIEGDGFLEYAGGDDEGSLTVMNTASTVHAILSVAGGGPLTVAVREDLPPLDREWCGPDAGEDPDHGCAVVVEGEAPRSYWLVKRPAPETHELILAVGAIVASKGLRVHGFKFA
jgi:hypothetical protein